MDRRPSVNKSVEPDPRLPDQPAEGGREAADEALRRQEEQRREGSGDQEDAPAGGF